jgi:hypothetical protein
MVSNGMSMHTHELHTAIVWDAHKRNSVLTLHGGRDAIAKEFRLWSELPNDADAICRGNIEECGDRWVV